MPFLSRLFGKRPTSTPKVSRPEPAINGDFRFIAVDVETANSNSDSICQIGLALVSSNNEMQTVSLLVDPRQDFDAFNIDLHGIGPHEVRGAPDFAEHLSNLRPALERSHLVQHSNFDKRAFDAACKRYDLPPLRSNWIDSVRIARNAWPELKGNGGHGLANLKKHLNLEFNHHDAEEDARAAAQVVLMAEDVLGIDFTLAAKPKKRSGFEQNVAISGDASGPLFGHTACFTGKLELARAEAATLAARAGITVKASVSKKVTLLIVGDQDLTLLAGHNKSTKHRRAEELIEQGCDIRIIGETEFVALVRTTGEDN